MKRLLALLFALMITSTSTAFAAKARSIDSDADSSFHAKHLVLHIGESSCHATGNYLKTRSQSNKDKVIGHLEQADVFQLLEVKNGYALIQVVDSHKTSPDSWEGMTGWVDSDYIDCACSSTEYINPSNTNSNSATGYSSVLDFFYQAISEKWDNDRIAAADFEPYEFPDNLNESGFIYWDINDDGIDELFIFRGFDAEIDPLLAGYTLVNGYPVRLFSSWARNRHYLRTDGSIYNEGSNGAAYSVCYVYDLVGSQLVVREGVLSGDYEEHGETKYGWFLVDERADFSYTEHKLIPDEEAERRIALYQDSIIYQFDNYIPFSEYTYD